MAIPSAESQVHGHNEPIIDTEAFRDSIATVDEKGRRRWLLPHPPSGRFHNARVWVTVVLLTLLFSGPFLKMNGNPMFLFNILERKFIIFGITFWPQDFHLFVLAMISFFIFIVLFTVIYGRVWCGWACPQTLFMEMVFRKIEYLIEGTAAQQKRLNKGPWNSEKIFKKTAKFSIFFLISFLIGNTLMAYIVGIDRLKDLITHSPAENGSLFAGVMIFSFLFFFVFTYLREQVCIAICPYGRLQGVLLSNDSIVISYDWIRGEPRGKRKKKQATATPQGDCIDCHKCVAVCPTGIDIRNGTQLECVNCTACIDACDDIMTKIGKPKGLIRYASYNGVANQQKFRFTPRIIAYSVVLVGLLSVLGFSLASRNDVEATILRTPGILYQRNDEGNITNLYNIQVVNKTINEYDLGLRLVSPEGEIQWVGQELELEKQGIAKGAFFLVIEPDKLDGRKNTVIFEVTDGDKVLDRVKTNFLGPR